MQSLMRLTIFLCCAWAFTLLYGEVFAYLIPRLSCSWPEHPSNSSDVADRVKVAVIADPQLMDSTSLRLAPRSFALEAAKFYTDLYMSRSFHMSILPFRPDILVFLGDHFDGGPWLSDQEWQESLSRFRRIFSLNGERRKSDMSVYYLSGNHDIGYSSLHSQYPQVISRYEKEFGPRNYPFAAGNVEFVVVDAQTLDGFTSLQLQDKSTLKGPEQGIETSLSWKFVENISKVDSGKPRVLLTHIPLYRPDETPCGPHRSSSVINQRISYEDPDHTIRYQNYLSKETSSRLLELIKPILVLSGHDHDQCTVTHSTLVGLVTEHTVGTVSWQQGNLYPSFMLLTITSPSNTIKSKDPVATHLCFLPMQTHIYIWYLFQFIMTLLLLIFWPTNGFGCWERFSRCVSFIRSIGRNTSKEKDDEEDCDYEMVWDAEGSMHLVKKATPRGPVKSDTGSTGRGNATIRPAAKKNTVVLELEVSPSLDVSSGKVSRSSKSRARRIIQRLIRVLQLLTIIAGVNVPLYMMLLFKDWRDR